MAITNKLKSHTTYIDGQLVQLSGPDDTSLWYQFDQQQRVFYIRESLLTATAKHGQTHVSQDPIPEASCDAPGLLGADDKCKLDSLVGTRLGVLGFQGAGFPDDGGWMQGDIILAAGSDFISLERVGNVIRFVVDVPNPFACVAEECFQVYWIQDETEPNALRPPSCAGALPGINNYGEFKVYLFPESTVINPNFPQKTLKNKGDHPTFIFKRYDDGIGTNEGELDMVLKRNQQGASTIGWSFTPGATGKAECVWFTGLDNQGNRTEFKLNPNNSADLFGSILYKNHSITKQMAIITGYESDVLSNNRYKAKWWSVNKQEPVGDEFTITNIQQWDLDDDVKIPDAAFGVILPVGQLVDVWTVKCGQNDCHYSITQPNLNTNALWATLGAAEFGNTLDPRPELVEEEGTEGTAGTGTEETGPPPINDATILDPNEWGFTGLDDPMLVYVPGENKTIPSSGQANYTTNIVIKEGDATTPDQRHLEVVDDLNSDNLQRPVFIWHRSSLRNALVEVHMAKPEPSESGYLFPPVDVLLRAPVSVVGSKYGTVVENGSFSGGQLEGMNWVRIAGLSWHELPPRGAIKTLIFDGSFTYGKTMPYSAKLASTDGGSVYLATDESPIAENTVVELLHEEYTTPAARLQFMHNHNGHDLEMSATVGTLDMSVDFIKEETDETVGTAGIPFNTFVRGFSDYSMSKTFWQNGSAYTTTNGLETSDDNFFVLNGGVASDTEFYNILRVMVNEGDVWIWWNDMLLPPITQEGLSSNSPTDPFYPIKDVVKYGKFGLRLWPGAKIRRIVTRSKLLQFSHLSLGQLELS